MRLPLQPIPCVSPGVASLKPLVVPDSDEMKKNRVREDATNDVRTVDSFDDGNAENRPDTANFASTTVDDESVVSGSKEELSLVERRAALFNKLNDTRSNAKPWTKLPRRSFGATKVVANSGNELDEVPKENDMGVLLENQEQLNTSSPTSSSPPEQKTASHTQPREELVVSPSHLDFESKKKAIFNFAQSASHDFRKFKTGRSHFALKNPHNEGSNASTVKVDENEDFAPKIAGANDEGEVCKEESPCNNDLVLKYSASSESVNDDNKDAVKYSSPMPGATTTAVFSPSPHLLKPSQVNFKTYSDDLFRQTPVAPGRRDEKIDAERHLRSTHLEKKTADFPSRFSDVLSPTDFSTNFSDVVSPNIKPSPVKCLPSQPCFRNNHGVASIYEKKLMSAMASQSSHVPKSSCMKFDSRISSLQIESSSTMYSSSQPSKMEPPGLLHRQEKTASDVNHLSPKLHKPLQTNSRRSLIIGIATDNNSSANSPVEEDAPTPLKERVFSPINAQMLSDIVGFTSTFSEAIVSPRKHSKSPAVGSLYVDRYSPSHILASPNEGARKMTLETDMNTSVKQGATHMSDELEFSDFVGFAPTDFDSDNKETVSSTKSGIVDRVDFFDSPFMITSDADASSAFPDANNNFMDIQSAINKSTQKNNEADLLSVTSFNEKHLFSKFESERAPSTTDVDAEANDGKGCSDDNINESGEILGKELDEILNIMTSETPRDEQVCRWLSPNMREDVNPATLNTMPVETPNEEGSFSNYFHDDVKDDLRAKKNIFFGSRFNDNDVGGNDACVETLDAIRENIIASSRDQLEEKLSTIDEADEDFAAMSKMFKEQLSPELGDLFSQICLRFDRKVNDLEKKVNGSSIENSVIKDEMCHQHQQIQSLMVQLESSQDMMQANLSLVKEIEDLRAQIQVKEAEQKNKGGRGIFMYRRKKNKRTSRHVSL